MFFRTVLCAFCAASLLSPAALAQEPVAADQAKAEKPEDEGSALQKKLKFRETWLILDNAVNTQTLGVGPDYQSSNPSYEVSLSLRPRFYLYTAPSLELYLSGRADVIKEITNSDVTTRERDTTFSDFTFFLANKWKIGGSSDTWLLSQAPILTFPTSDFSINNGTALGVGGRFWFNQTVRLAGDSWPVFRRMHLGAVASFNYTFSEATTPTNPALRRVRLEPDGKTYPGDQLTGSAFPHTEVRVGALLIADITERIQLWLEAAYRPTWLYGFGPVDVCTQTGCAPTRPSQDPTTYVVYTTFAANVYYDLIPELTLGLGYDNIAMQLAPDGMRRSVFNSPSAQFHFVLWAHLDALYLAAIGKRMSAPIQY